ncbi:MAG: prolipoprotein diacylglyceryl transferase [Clostridia bacterium]|nr:prolipoprotein diacylglyceryl transferase [Clostridia bacterium]
MYNISFPGLGLKFSVNRVAFSMGDFNVYWYGIIIGVGFILALIFAIRSLKRYKINSDSFFDCVLAGLVGGIIGARLYYVAFRWDAYADNPMEIFAVHNGGLAIYGGIIGGLGAACIMAKIKKVNIPAMLDIGGMGFLIGQGIGRWGNLINQEAFGTPTDLPWGMVSENTGGTAVHPCFFYESVWCLLGFGILYFISRKWRKFDGQMFLLYMIWYGFERMIVEGLRTDSLYTPLFGLRVSQILSGIIVIIGIVLLVINLKKVKAQGELHTQY